MHTYLHTCTRYAILDVHFEIHIIMHKCVYTVTLDIECWNDLKVIPALNIKRDRVHALMHDDVYLEVYI